MVKALSYEYRGRLEPQPSATVLGWALESWLRRRRTFRLVRMASEPHAPVYAEPHAPVYAEPHAPVYVISGHWVVSYLHVVIQRC